jgi:hypothetical protein
VAQWTGHEEYISNRGGSISYGDRWPGGPDHKHIETREGEAFLGDRWPDGLHQKHIEMREGEAFPNDRWLGGPDQTQNKIQGESGKSQKWSNSVPCQCHINAMSTIFHVGNSIL